MTASQLENVERSVLIEMLAEKTARFTNLFRLYRGINPGQEYFSCKETIDAIISEIERRDASLKNDVVRNP
jgi:hypothetical protein